MKKILLALIFSIIFSGCARAQIKKEPFERVFDSISSPQVFFTSFESIMQQLGGLCNRSTRAKKDQYKYGNIECEKEIEVESFTISSSKNISSIQASFFGTNKCGYMKQALIKNFGKPTKATKECNLNWRLKPAQKGEQGKYIAVEMDQEKNIVYFEIGEEQGP